MIYILASNSPRRKELLGELGIAFEIQTFDVDETTALTEPTQVVLELSKKKARAYVEHLPVAQTEAMGEERMVIAADTIVSIDGKILGKPKSEEDAYHMLKMLAGKKHQVYTGVTLCRMIPSQEPEVLDEVKESSFFEKTDVFVKEMSDQEIWDYIATKEPMDKAGAYGIQGIFAKYIDHFEGDYNNVVGLPVDRLKMEIPTLIAL